MTLDRSAFLIVKSTLALFREHEMMSALFRGEIFIFHYINIQRRKEEEAEGGGGEVVCTVSEILPDCLKSTYFPSSTFPVQLQSSQIV